MNKNKRRKTTLFLVVLFSLAGIQKISPVLSQDLQLTPIFEDVNLYPKSPQNRMIIRGLSGGPVSAKETTGRNDTVTGPCVGFIDREPDHRLILNGFFQSLKLEVKSSEDTTLVIRGPGGSWCNDDFEGKNPGIMGQWFSGTYEIWVGSYQRNKYYPYVIKITKEED
ncbi:MAG: hypothetical protein F6K48_24660 [Okeania sp. SIO3H1]|uniref:hypothetical protein n=1 Tax=Okeania sp. SIO1I7 TaxID=2607772 RepID=UPI0013CA54A7|nr:hypothetical protein [Okeania sp. SIO1I7]NEN91925.1 hypothetical protein [Okeania sp. SIO3H1]NET27593.1 hypothetical protein [Okeania sp. SIO1I7]